MSDDFDDAVGLEDSFDDFDQKKECGTLGELWNSNPLFKIGTVVGVLVLVFVLIRVFGVDSAMKSQESYVGEARGVTAAPGTEEASPAYIKAIEEKNEQVVEEAQRTGGSALPVPIEPPVGVVSVPESDAAAEDPLQRWRRLQEERLQREIQQREVVDVAASGEARDAAIKELAQVMREQMSSILSRKTTAKMSAMPVTPTSFLKKLYESRYGKEGEEGGAGGGEGEFGEEVIQEVLLQAGEIAYAQLMIEANSDAKAPVIAQILSGPFKGSRIIGQFTVEKDLLLLTFGTLIYNEESLDVSAMGVDPKTNLPGMATDVDHHYLQRIVVPAAAAFVEGLTGAIADSGTTNITIDGGTGTTTQTTNENLNSDQEVATGVAEAGKELRDIIKELNEDLETTVRIEAGTPIGILFLEPVTTQDETI